MGGSFAPGFPNQHDNGSSRGSQNVQKPAAIAGGRRTMPGGPLFPRLPSNPYATAARKVVRLSTPQQPKSLNRMF